MRHKLFRRMATVGVAAALAVGAATMLSGCTTDKPEITITYTFNGKDYSVDYVLSRKSAPQTVQHFIELADNGYYEGLCIHDYSSSMLLGGGYTYENGELTEKNYFEAVKDYDLTQSVFVNSDSSSGMNTVYGEFSKNGVSVTGAKYTHTAGALVMYYTDKGTDNSRVYTLRNDNNKLQSNSEYKYNSATSLFYTFTGDSKPASDSLYCVFGMATDFENQMYGDNGLLTAIDKFSDELSDGQNFTEEHTERNINQYDPVDSVRNAIVGATFHVPIEPIVIKSVKVNKY